MPKITPSDFVFDFGKHKGRSVMEVAILDPGYIVWAQNNIEWFNVEPELLKVCEGRTRTFGEDDNEGWGDSDDDDQIGWRDMGDMF